jgi:mycothiol synthase
VHPDRRGQGLGRKLLASAIERARSEQARRLDVWAYNDSGASARIAAHLGFEASRRLLHLHRHLTMVPAVARREDVTVRTFWPGEDDERWLALNNRIFRAHPENGCWTLDDLRSRFEQPWFDAGDFLLLEVDGELAGFCWLKVEERGTEGRVGEIYVIGTAPERRGRGLGKHLVATALGHLRERAVNVAAIYVDEANAPAVALYEQSGFHYHHVDVCYSRAISTEDRVPAASVAA